MGSLGRWRAVAVVAAVVVVLLIVDWLAWLSPESHKLSTLSSEKQSLEARQSSLASQIESLKVERGQLPRNCAKLVKDVTAIPGTPSIDAFYAQLSQLATSSGVSTPSITNQVEKPGAPGQLSAVTFTLTVKGNYGQMSAFLHGLDTFPRLLTVAQLQVNGGGAPAGGGPPVVSGGGSIPPSTPGYTLTMTGTIYYVVGEVDPAKVCPPSLSGAS
jgi:Tfp pilus assembly protein PilO